MFTKQGFIETCRGAVGEGQKAVREAVAEAVADPAAVLAELGEPEHAGIVPLHRAPDLTILNFTWAPCMSLMPHNHQMFAVIGIYSGREDNIFWRRRDATIEAAGAESLGVGDVATLGRDIIHSVLNPVARMTCAIHVYGGDFFDPPDPRSEWDHETLEEQPWDIDRVRGIFRDAEARFNAAGQHQSGSPSVAGGGEAAAPAGLACTPFPSALYSGAEAEEALMGAALQAAEESLQRKDPDFSCRRFARRFLFYRKDPGQVDRHCETLHRASSR